MEVAAKSLGPMRLTLRDRLRDERDRLQSRLDEVSGLLAKMDANPAVAEIVDEVFKVIR